MTKMKPFIKEKAFKKNKSNKSVWSLLCASILVITIVVFRSYAEYVVTKEEIAISNSSVGKFYTEALLNGADPVLTNNLVPVTIGNDGTVYEASTGEEWYKYEDKRWANAVVLKERYDEDTIYDLSGNGNHATIYGATMTDEGLYFDGVNDYAVVDLLEWNNTTEFTIEFEVKVFETGHRLSTLFESSVNSNFNEGSFYINSEEYGTNDLTLAMKYPSSALVNHKYVNEIIDESYKTYTITFNSKNAYNNFTNIYVDGVKQELDIPVSNEIDLAGDISLKTLKDYGFFIGSRNGELGFTKMNLKSLKIYTKELSEDDISSNNYSSDDLILMYDLDGYSNDGIIEENYIESYFVWVPKYSYQLWDLGNYSSETGIDTTKKHAISIRFGTTNTSDGVIGECATPGVAGSSGNCSVGDYMTHPAFLAFDTNGLWVAKFKVGYDGATSSILTIDTDISKVLIKPNTYFWRADKQKYIFKTSYNYLREDESHMMKNTEWGAVAYLSNSLYGTCTVDTCDEIRLNNNVAGISGYSDLEEPTISWSSNSIEGNYFESTGLGVDGTYTINYFNPASVISSTTLNYYGIYDMSGGWWEFVMGYTNGASTVGGTSEITTEYEDFFTNINWNKYYDLYTSTLNTEFNNRILGDATGEMGPFANLMSSWNNDKVAFIKSSNPWMQRGASAKDGYWTGLYAFNPHFGEGNTFRIVLAPK